MPLAASVTPSPHTKRASKMSSSQSLNHLLNFTLPPRQTHVNVPRRSSRKANGSSVYGVRSTERFVNAQYRFVMNPTGDYTVHFADPDIFFQWHDVLQVIVPRTSAVASAGSHKSDETLTTCPICLSPPTAPRMTKCGHVFCFPCILHYLNVSDVDKWIRCPICFDSVHEKQLKSVKWFDDHVSDLGEPGQEDLDQSLGLSHVSPTSTRFLRMRLIQRPQITTLALPRSSTWPSDLIPPHQAPFHFLPDVFAFSKFMLATPAYLVADLNKDLNDLIVERRILTDMGDRIGLIFIEAAENKIRTQIKDAEAMYTDSLERAIDKAQRELVDIKQRHERIQRASTKNIEVTSTHEDTPDVWLNHVGTEPSALASLASRTARSRRNVNPPPPSTLTYYYYQSAAGSPIFLHPLDIRILLSHFSSYPAFPDEITVKVEAFTEGSVNEDLRKRCKYLALPEGADVVFVEADLESVVGAEALKNFESAIKTRRTKRKEKNRKAERAKFRAEDREREEREKIYGAPTWEIRDGHDSKPHPEWPPSASETEPEPALVPSALEPQQMGLWGSRSFAAAVHASSPTPQPQTQRPEDAGEDEWDVDIAWHELQHQGGGRKKGRKQKMMILGGGAGGARRR